MKRLLLIILYCFLSKIYALGLVLYNDEYHCLENVIITESLLLMGEQCPGYPCDIKDSVIKQILSYGCYRSVINNSIKGNNINLFDNSTCIFNNSNYQSIDLYDNSQAVITDGRLLGIFADDNSKVTVQGATVSKYLEVKKNSVIDIWGMGGSTLTYLEDAGGTFILHGSFNTYVSHDGSLYITGNYLNGLSMRAIYYPSNVNAKIIFVPEPSTLIILFIGGLFLHKKTIPRI